MILINFEFTQTVAEQPKLKIYKEQVREALTLAGVSNLSIAVKKTSGKLSLSATGPDDEIGKAQKIFSKFAEA